MSLCSSPALGLPNYSLPFHLYATERVCTAAGLLTQEHGGGYRPVTYLPETFNPIVYGMHLCLKAVSASAIMVSGAEKLVLAYLLTLHTSHQVQTILCNLQTQHMTTQYHYGYKGVLYSIQHFTSKFISDILSAHLLRGLLTTSSSHTSDDPHDCMETYRGLYKLSS